MSDTIIIDTITGPGMGTIVVPTPEQVERQTSRLRATDGGTEAAAVVQERYEGLRARLADKIVRIEYPFTAYTHGQSIDVQRRHTRWNELGPQTDYPAMRSELAALSIGMTSAEFGKLSPVVARAIIEEVSVRTEPDPEYLDFLGSLPTS